MHDVLIFLSLPWTSPSAICFPAALHLDLEAAASNAADLLEQSRSASGIAHLVAANGQQTIAELHARLRE